MRNNSSLPSLAGVVMAVFVIGSTIFLPRLISKAHAAFLIFIPLFVSIIVFVTASSIFYFATGKKYRSLANEAVENELSTAALNRSSLVHVFRLSQFLAKFLLGYVVLMPAEAIILVQR